MLIYSTTTLVESKLKCAIVYTLFHDIKLSLQFHLSHDCRLIIHHSLSLSVGGVFGQREIIQREKLSQLLSQLRTLTRVFILSIICIQYCCVMNYYGIHMHSLSRQALELLGKKRERVCSKCVRLECNN